MLSTNRDVQCIGSQVTVDNYTFHTVKEFIYIGFAVTTKYEIKRRITLVAEILLYERVYPFRGLKVWHWNSISVKSSFETIFFFFSVESLTLTKKKKMDCLTITWTTGGIRNFSNKISLPMKHILHSVGMLINKIVVCGVLKILKWLKIGFYIQKKSLFSTLSGPKVCLSLNSSKTTMEQLSPLIRSVVVIW